jgi:hypothetical protein
MVSRTDEIQGALRVLVFALLVRVGGAWVLGEGAPFGPDGTGAEAAVHLGGHPYPLHIALLHLTGGSARALSMAAGAISAALLWSWGRRLGLGGVGGWLAAAAPITVLPGVLAGGDAPALAVVLAGAWVTTLGGPWVILGGALAAASVAVKPIALPAMVLLLARPRSLVGAVPVLLLLHGFTRPLWQPVPDAGLLGTWWISSGGAPPAGWLGWAWGGIRSLLSAPIWSCVVLLALVLVGSWQRRTDRRLLAVGLGAIAAAWCTAALFGGRMEARYLAAAIWAGLPLAGAVLADRRLVVGILTGLLIWPTAGLLTQLGAYRQVQDPLARIPAVPVVWFPADPRPLFDACSTAEATRMRLLAFQIAEVAPTGATITTPARSDGREGELLWPLQVLRPDLKVQSRD